MSTKTVKAAPAAKKPAVAAKPAAKAAPAPKSAVPGKLKDAAKVTTTVCASITKEVVDAKKLTLSKDEVMKLVEVLDTMGEATYKTACALRDLCNRI
jgi:hypothetical protein